MEQAAASLLFPPLPVPELQSQSHIGPCGPEPARPGQLFWNRSTIGNHCCEHDPR